MPDIRIPQIGESLTTVFISRWLKKPGETIRAGEPLLEVDSDKASMEVPSPEDGVVRELLAEEGDEVEIGAVVARVEAGEVAEATEPAAEEAPTKDGPVRAGPAARQKATERGVDLADVKGSGPKGRVTSKDVEASSAPTPAKTTTPAPKAAPAAPIARDEARIERVRMTPLRRTIARRLVQSQQEAAMLTTFNEVDMSAVMEIRKKYQDSFQKRYGIKLGFMSFFVKAAIAALQEFPAVNAEIDGDEIVYKRYWNIGVAVSGPKGLVVPVIRDADRLSFAETEKAIAEMSTRARDNKLSVEDFQDGTFTVSNGGIFGSMLSTPILNPPQVGILGMHNIVKRAVVLEDDSIVVRPVMYLALSYDHRIIDGREAVSFLVRIKQLIEAPERLLVEA